MKGNQPQLAKLALADCEQLLVEIDVITAQIGRFGMTPPRLAQGPNPLHLVSAWAARQRIVLGQLATGEKSNEITTIPLLLRHLDLRGELVTIDAMGTQTGIAQAIRDGGGDYCLCVKKNWPAVHADVEALFDAPPPDLAIDGRVEIEKNGGGRPETRRHTVCHEVDWIKSDRRYPGDPVFPDLAMTGCIESKSERDGTVERQTRYYLCSAQLDAKPFAPAVRARWGVENRPHWVLDMVFMRILVVCALATARRTWRSFAMPRSISCARPNRPPA